MLAALLASRAVATIPASGLAMVLVSWLAVGACGRSAASLQAPSGPVIVVANQDRGVATFIDLTSGRVLGDIDVGIDPHEAAVSPDGRTVAFASPSTFFGSANKVVLLDAATATLSRTIDLGEFRWPHGIAFRDARTLLVSSRDNAAVVVVDVESGEVTGAIDNGGAQPYLLHLVRSTQRGYTSNPATLALTEVDLTAGRLLRTWKIADDPAGFNVAPDGKSLWVATGNDDVPYGISVIDLPGGNVVARLSGFAQPRRLAFSPDGAKVVITDGADLRVFDARSRQELARVHLGDGANASGVAFRATAALCYVALSGAGVVAEVDLDGFAVTRTFAVGAGADGIAFAPLQPSAVPATAQ